MNSQWCFVPQYNSFFPVPLNQLQIQPTSTYVQPVYFQVPQNTQPMFLKVEPLSCVQPHSLHASPYFVQQQPYRSFNGDDALLDEFKQGVYNNRLTVRERQLNFQNHEYEGDLSNNKFQKRLKNIKKLNGVRNGNYRQNPSRNIITNIGNQLITFLTNPTKCQQRLKELRPRYSEEEHQSFFQYMKQVKKATDYYLNSTKMSQFWFPENQDQIFEDYQKIIRSISLYFLIDILPSCILTSTKMKKQTKWHHLRIRKQLISILSSKGFAGKHRGKKSSK